MCGPAVMSSNGETSVVLRGVTHGAVDFLIKPVRVEELRNVWQHVVRRRKDKVRMLSLPQTCSLGHEMSCCYSVQHSVHMKVSDISHAL